jgi:spore maturation protein CgeB
MFTCNEIICYENGKELIDLTKYYLEHKNERDKIGEKGERRLTRSTRMERVKEMLRTIG